MKHLPECPNHCINVPADYMERDVYMRRCICEKLRACEDRVARAFHVVRKYDTREWEKFSLDQFDAGFSEGLDAAIREAVAALPEYRMRDTCVSAIDELREEKK